MFRERHMNWKYFLKSLRFAVLVACSFQLPPIKIIVIFQRVVVRVGSSCTGSGCGRCALAILQTGQDHSQNCGEDRHSGDIQTQITHKEEAQQEVDGQVAVEHGGQQQGQYRKR